MAQISSRPPQASSDEVFDGVCPDDSTPTWAYPNITKARGGETPSHGYGMALIPEGESDPEGGDFEGGGPEGAGP